MNYLFCTTYRYNRRKQKMLVGGGQRFQNVSEEDYQCKSEEPQEIEFIQEARGGSSEDVSKFPRDKSIEELMKTARMGNKGETHFDPKTRIMRRKRVRTAPELHDIPYYERPHWIYFTVFGLVGVHVDWRRMRRYLHLRYGWAESVDNTTQNLHGSLNYFDPMAGAGTMVAKAVPVPPRELQKRVRQEQQERQERQRQQEERELRNMQPSEIRELKELQRKRDHLLSLKREFIPPWPRPYGTGPKPLWVRVINKILWVWTFIPPLPKVRFLIHDEVADGYLFISGLVGGISCVLYWFFPDSICRFFGGNAVNDSTRFWIPIVAAGNGLSAFLSFQAISTYKIGEKKDAFRALGFYHAVSSLALLYGHYRSENQLPSFLVKTIYGGLLIGSLLNYIGCKAVYTVPIIDGRDLFHPEYNDFEIDNYYDDRKKRQRLISEIKDYLAKNPPGKYPIPEEEMQLFGLCDCCKREEEKRRLKITEQPDEPEQPKQSEPPEQGEQSEQSKQSEPPKQSEQSIQSEPPKQSEPAEQHGETEQTDEPRNNPSSSFHGEISSP